MSGSNSLCASGFGVEALSAWRSERLYQCYDGALTCVCILIPFRSTLRLNLAMPRCRGTPARQNRIYRACNDNEHCSVSARGVVTTAPSFSGKQPEAYLFAIIGQGEQESPHFSIKKCLQTRNTSDFICVLFCGISSKLQFIFGSTGTGRG